METPRLAHELPVVPIDPAADNDRHAAHNRGVFNRKHTRALNLLSSPGAGKTVLLEKTLTAMRGRGARCAVVEGDQASDIDSKRLARAGVPVLSIAIGRTCHLEASQVEAALDSIDVPERGLVFIENVGSLVCPTSLRLGEHERVSLLSVAEGHDKPLKYPQAFRNATVMVITKMDLLPHVDFDLVEARRLLRELNPRAPLFEVSAVSGEGMDEWLGWVFQKLPADV